MGLTAEASAGGPRSVNDVLLGEGIRCQNRCPFPVCRGRTPAEERAEEEAGELAGEPPEEGAAALSVAAVLGMAPAVALAVVVAQGSLGAQPQREKELYLEWSGCVICETSGQHPPKSCCDGLGGTVRRLVSKLVGEGLSVATSRGSGSQLRVRRSRARRSHG